MGEALGSSAPASWRHRRSTVGTVCDDFVLAENIQLVAAEIYSSLSGKLRGDPELRALFALLSGEERSRAKRIRRATEICREREIAAVPTLDTLRLKELLAQMKKCHEKVLHAPTAGSECALKLARLVEHELAAVRAEALLSSDAPGLKEELRALEAEDHAHTALLSRLEQLDKRLAELEEAQAEQKDAEEEWLLADLTATSVALP